MKVYYSNLCVGPQFIREKLRVKGGEKVRVKGRNQTLFNSVSFDRPELEKLTKGIKMDPKVPACFLAAGTYDRLGLMINPDTAGFRGDGGTGLLYQHTEDSGRADACALRSLYFK